MHEIGVGMSVGRIAYWHNIRSGELPKNVDPNRVKDNVILIDDIQKRSIDQWINDTMQLHIDAYNAKQKRKDRKINTTYVEWHNNNGNYTQNHKIKDNVRIATEFVLSYGGHDNIGGEYFSPTTSPERKQEIYDQAVRLFTKWTNDFQEMYPHLKLGLAVIHADEPNGSIHMHGIVLPQATYTRGLPVQCCWSRSLEQDGIEKIQDAEKAQEAGGFQLARLYKQFREHMEQDLKMQGFTIKPEEHGKEHIPSNAYTELMTKATEEMDKAKSMVSFAEKVDQIQKESEKVISYDSSRIVKKTVKDSILAKPREVYEVPVDIYESQQAMANIRKLSEAAERAAERTEALSSKVLDSIESSANKGLQERVEELQQEVYRQRTIIQEKDKTINKLNSILNTVIDFLHEHNLLQVWERFKQRIKTREQEREERTR